MASKTHIVVVMDKSGSMNGLAVEAAGSTNTFIESLKDIKGSKSVTIHQFDDRFETTCSQVPPSKVPELVAGKNYVPRGLTSLYDAIGKSITAMGNKKRVVMCVVTDGGENNSSDYTYDAIKTLIEKKTKAGWKFDFLSSDLQAVNVASTLGFSQSVAFAANAAGYADIATMRSRSVSDYMKSGS